MRKLLIVLLLILVNCPLKFGMNIKSSFRLSSCVNHVIVDSLSTGVDISKYQGNIKWCELDTNIDFVICKATEGTSIIDKKFKKNWDSIKCIKGAYHYFRPQISGVKQANYYLSVVNLKPGDIRPIIDVEFTKSWRKNRKSYTKNLKDMIDILTKKTGHAPIIYTSTWFWNRHIHKKYKGEHILWVADYRKREVPTVPNGFIDWTIWQYSDKGNISGIPNKVDLNICKNLDTLVIK